MAKDMELPNLDSLAPSLIELTNECGGSKDQVKVRVYKAKRVRKTDRVRKMLILAGMGLQPVG